MRNSYFIDKICGVELPPPTSWKVGDNFLEYRSNKTTHFARQNDFYALLAINKANHILNRLFCAPIETQFIVQEKKCQKAL